MTENVTSMSEADAPTFSVQKIYVKDLSFENPNSPEMFTAASQPKIEMNLGLENRQVDANHWEVSLKISAVARDSESEKVLFDIEVEQAGLFYLDNIPEEHMEALLAVDCPAVIFPYTRQIVSQQTVDGGYMPLILEPVNFEAVYANNIANKQVN